MTNNIESSICGIIFIAINIKHKERKATMKNIKLTILIGAIASLLSLVSISAKAENWGMGITGSIMGISADGNESDSATTTETGDKQSKSVENIVVVPSVFLEYNTGFFGTTVGIDWIPINSKLSSKTFNRTDNETSVTDTAAQTDNQREHKANAQLENHLTLYTDINVIGSTYLKLGVGQVDIQTKESLATGGSYGDVTADFTQVGLGVKGDVGSGYMKTEVVYTDYEDIKLTNGTKTINAEIDTMQFRVGYAMAF